MKSGSTSAYFNSRPSARGDRAPQSRRAASAHFNSRPSARGDTNGCVKRFTLRQISIHAPPRGATPRSPKCLNPLKIFQFTPLREGRLPLSVVRCSGSLFQFTPLREGRQGARMRKNADCTNFNSRPSARGDFTSTPPAGRPFHFNSRPSARGDRCSAP